MDKLLTLISTIQDNLKKVGKTIDIPVVAVVGSQSAGKSSVLESVISLDLLPKKAGLCTRVPLEIILIHDPSSKVSTGKFKHLSASENDKFQLPDEKDNLKNIREEILDRTDKTTGPQEIKDIPIFLEVRSSKVPNLVLIDLPGVTKVSVSGQTSDIVENISNLVKKYILRENTIILAVSPANVDIANSDSLQLARLADPQGMRTVGVITKIDLMDKGTDAREILLNEVYPLQLGYIGVVNRSQEDLRLGLSLEDSKKKEIRFFKDSKVYKDLAHKNGSSFLSEKVSDLLIKKIKGNVPYIQSELWNKLREMNEELEVLGCDLSTFSNRELKIAVNEILRNYSDRMKGSLKGNLIRQSVSLFDQKDEMHGREKEKNFKQKQKVKSELEIKEEKEEERRKTILKENYSSRKAGIVKVKRDLIFHSRYMVHNNGSLTWYKSAENLKSPRTFSMVDFDVPESFIDIKNFTFQISSENKTIVFKVLSIEELKEWIEALKKGREFLKSAGKRIYVHRDSGSRVEKSEGDGGSEGGKNKEKEKEELKKKSTWGFSWKNKNNEEVEKEKDKGYPLYSEAGSLGGVIPGTKSIWDRFVNRGVRFKDKGKKVLKDDIEISAGSKIKLLYLVYFLPEIERCSVVELTKKNPFLLKNSSGANFFDGLLLAPFSFKNLVAVTVREMKPICIDYIKKIREVLEELVDESITSKLNRYSTLKNVAVETVREFIDKCFKNLIREIDYLFDLNENCLNGCENKILKQEDGKSLEIVEYVDLYVKDLKVKLVDSIWKYVMVFFLNEFHEDVRERLSERILYLNKEDLLALCGQDPRIAQRMVKVKKSVEELENVVNELSILAI